MTSDHDVFGMIAAALAFVLAVACVALLKKLHNATRVAEEAAAQRMQAQKMEAVGQLTGGIAHDYNNILAVLLGNLEMLEKRVAPTDPESFGFLRVAKKSVERASELTQRLLTFSRDQNLAPAATDVNTLIGSMLNFVGRSIGQDIAVKTEFDESVPPIMVDPNQLETALLNLILNARDAMPSGGQLMVQTYYMSLTAEQAGMVGLAAGPYAVIMVADTGTGMPPEVLEHAAEPFFTTKDVGKGSGLGLSMVFGFAQQSGGTVHLDSTVGRGTSVTIYLPAAAVTASVAAPMPFAKAEQQDRFIEPLPQGRETILLVDDEKGIQVWMENALGELGYTILTASNGPDAVDILSENHDIDVLITDLSMPGGMNGFKLAERALELKPRLGVIVSSGYAQEHLSSNLLPDEQYIFMAKPYTIESLANGIRSVVEKHRTLN